MSDGGVKLCRFTPRWARTRHYVPHGRMTRPVTTSTEARDLFYLRNPGYKQRGNLKQFIGVLSFILTVILS